MFYLFSLLKLAKQNQLYFLCRYTLIEGKKGVSSILLSNLGFLRLRVWLKQTKGGTN